MDINYQVSEIDLSEYLTTFSALRTPLSDFYLRSKLCSIIGVKDGNGIAKGFLLAETGYVTEVLLINVEADDTSLKRALLDHLVGLLAPGSRLRWRLKDQASNEKLAYEYGFSYSSTLNIYRTVTKEDKAAIDVLKKYEKPFAFMEQHGYQTVCFDELTDEQLSQIKDDPQDEFDSFLLSGMLIDDRAGGFSGQMSFAALKNGRVVAYSILRCPDSKSCIFEVICVAKSHQKTGVFVLPFLSSLRKMAASDIKNALFAVYDSNPQMMALAEKYFAPLIASKSVQHNLMMVTPRR